MVLKMFLEYYTEDVEHTEHTNSILLFGVTGNRGLYSLKKGKWRFLLENASFHTAIRTRHHEFLSYFFVMASCESPPLEVLAVLR